MARPVYATYPQRLTLLLGKHFQHTDSDIRVDTNGLGVGTEVDFESDLGLASRRAPALLQADLCLAARWRLELEHFSTHRDARVPLPESITWDDTTYPVNTPVSSRLDLDIYRLGVHYAAVANPRLRLGLAAGLHVTRVDTGLAAAGVGDESVDFLAPLPTLGLRAAYALTPVLLARADADYYQLSYADYRGRIATARIALEYWPLPHLGLGLGYRGIDTKLRADLDEFHGRFTYRLDGPVLYLSTGF